MIEDSKCFWEFTCIDSGTVFGTTFKKRGVVMGYHGRHDTTCAFWPVRTLSKWHKFTSTEPCTYIQPYKSHAYKREPKCPQNGSLIPRLPRSGTQTLKLCRRGEPGIFCHVKSTKDRREVDATLIVCGRMRFRTEKGTKVAVNLLHVSSYRALNNIHTER